MADAPPTPAEIQYMKMHIQDNAQPTIIAVLTVSCFLAYVATALRLLARWRSRTRVSWDDYLILIGLVIVTGSHVTTAHMVVYGFGRHLLLVTNRAGLIQSTLAAQALYTLSLPPIKISILCLYHRIFPSKKLYRISIALGIFIIAYSIVQAVCIVVQCLPISNYVNGGPTTCINFAVVLMLCAILNVVTDVMLLAMPIPLIWTLNLRRSKRLQLVATFAAGGIVTGISIARAVFVGQPPTPDKSWFDVVPAIMSQVELSIAVLSACMPTYRPLLRTRNTGTKAGSSQYYGGSGSGHVGSRYAKGTQLKSMERDPPSTLEAGRKDWLHLDSMNRDVPDERSSSELNHSWPLQGAHAESPGRVTNEKEPRGIVVRTDVQVQNERDQREQRRNDEY